MKDTVKGIGFDTLAIAAAAATLFVLISTLDLVEKVVRFTERHEYLGTDEALGALILALTAATVLACRRLCMLRMQARAMGARIEQASQGSDLFSSVLDSIIDPFVIISADKTIFKANKAYAEMAGLPHADLAGRNCMDVLECSKSLCADCLATKTFKTKAPGFAERPSGPGGSLDIWHEIHTYPIFSPEGEVTHVIEYTREITERKRAEEENRRIMGKLEELSRRDYLTGLFNRRALMDKAEYEFGRADRYDTPLCLMMIDIDALRDINAAHGQQAGDIALTAIADLIVRTARKPDIVGRYGGDEFVLLLPMTPSSGARELGGRLVARAAETRITLVDGLAPRLSLSIGVAMLREGVTSLDELVRRAEAALMSAKADGRGRVSLYDEAHE